MGRRYHKNYPAVMRRRYGVPPGQYSEGMGVVRGYQTVLRTSPTVPVLFELPKWAGRQILWQDPDGTIPVESIGDPIGGVAHPLTGDILAVQTTDSARPMYGGIGVGAIFDGVDDEMVVDWSTGALPHTVAIAMRHNTDGGSPFGIGASSSRLRITGSGDDLRTRYLRATSGPGISNVDIDQFGAAFGLFGTDGATEYGVGWRHETSFTDDGGDVVDGGPMYIGSYGGAGYVEMDARFFAIWSDHILDDGQRSIIERAS